MPPPSLLQLSTATAIRYAKQLNDIGSIPYFLARPFLLKIESPEKLRSIEQLSPHIINDDHELWFEFIKRDIPQWEEYDLPDDCSYDVYCDLRENVQKKIEEDAEKLKMALDGIHSERTKHSAKFVDRKAVPLPRERPTAKQRYASFDRKMGGIKPVFSAGNNGFGGDSDPLSAPRWSFERPSVPREPKKKSSIFTATKRNNVLAVPTKQLHNRASQVRQAPRSLIEEHKSEPVAPRRPAPPASMGPPRLDKSTPVMSESVLKDREDRLRAFTIGRKPRFHFSKSSEESSPPKSSAQRQVSSPAKKPLPTASRSQNPSQPRESSKPVASEKTASNKSSSPPAQAPRAAPLRKRPAPSVFMPPKRKKMA